MRKNNLEKSSIQETQKNDGESPQNGNANGDTIDEKQDSITPTTEGNNNLKNISKENTSHPLACRREVESEENIYSSNENEESSTAPNTEHNDGVKIVSVKSNNQQEFTLIEVPPTQPPKEATKKKKTKSKDIIYCKRDKPFLEKITKKNLDFLFQKKKKYAKEQFYNVLHVNELELFIEIIDIYLKLAYKYKDINRVLYDEIINRLIYYSSYIQPNQDYNSTGIDSSIGESTLDENNPIDIIILPLLLMKYMKKTIPNK